MVKMLHEQNIELIMEMHFTDKAPGYILDCVRYWVENYHIDGVHYYGSQAGLEALAADPFLSDTKIITVNWEGKEAHSGIWEAVMKIIQILQENF